MAYNGFISYSHAADGRLAPALQSGLQSLAKPWYRPRALRVFRDETGLSTNPHLWSSIAAALDESEWFVLLASPESARSPWVDRELAHWLETKPADRILPALTSGEWGWDAEARHLVGDSVPERLRAAVSEEPRHLDLRWARDETDLDLRNSGFRSAVADLAAPMHGVAKDELEGEDIRQHRRARRLARGGVTALALLVVVSLITTVFAVGQRDQAQRSSNEALARGLTAEVGAESAEHSYATALLLAAEATRFGGLAGSDPSTTRQAHEALLGTVATAPWMYGSLSGVRGTVDLIRFSPNGKIVVSSSSTGQLRAWELPSLQALAELPPPDGLVSDLAVNDSGLVARAGYSIHSQNDAYVQLWDLRTHKPWRWQPPEPRRIPTYHGQALDTSSVALNNGGLLAVARSEFQSGPGTTTLSVWNVLTGRQVLGPLSITGTEASVAISPDARTVAVSVTLGNGNTSLLTQLVDVPHGTLGPLLDGHPQGLFDPIDDPGLRAIVFSADSRLVSSVATSGSATSPDVATFDVATGARVGGPSVEEPPSSALAVSSDLRALVLGSSSGASVVDTATGATLAEVPIAGAINGGATTPPVAVDPVEPIVAFQVGQGSITLADWGQVGAPHFASFARSGRIAGPVALSPAAAPVGLAPPLRLLGLPLQTSPQEPWFAMASSAGPVAILSSSGIAVWDPTTGRITHRLTGIPSDCEVGDFVPNDMAFTGSASTGHVVVSCGNAVMMWALASSRSTPTWRLPYSGAAFNNASIQVSDDGAVVTYVTAEGAEIRDGRTGRLQASGPTAGEDEIVNTVLSGDGRVLATVLSSGTVVLVDTANGSVLQTLEAEALPVADNGWPGTIAEPMLALSPDGQFVATWHAVTGVQLWDATTGQSIAVLDGRRIAETRIEDASSPGDQAGALTFNHAGNQLVLKDLQSYPPPSVGGAQTGAPYAVTRTITWSMRPSDLMRAACAMVRRDLTSAEWDSYVGAGVPYHQTCTPLLGGR